MTVIKNHTSIIYTAEINNGKQVILGRSPFLTLSLSHTNTNNEQIHCTENESHLKGNDVIIGL